MSFTVDLGTRYTRRMRTHPHRLSPARSGRPSLAPRKAHGPPFGLVLLLSVLPLGACDPCHSWDALEIDVEQSDHPDETLERIEDAAEQFIDWTQREETCVKKVEVQQSLRDGVGGLYFPKKRIIHVLDSAYATVHEFCHALDHEEGWISETGADVLGQYTVALEGNPLYPTEKARIPEIFAQMCDDGPQVAVLAEELNDACGLDANLDAVRFVRDVAFPQSVGGQTLEGLATPFSFESMSTSVEGTQEEAGVRSTIVVRGEAGIFVYDQIYLSNWEEVDDYVVPRILLLDAGSGQLLDTLELEPHGAFEVDGNISYTEHRLFGSSTSPILAGIAGDSAGQVWRVESAPLRLEAADLPELDFDGYSSGFEHEGKLMVHSGSTGPVQLLDLASGDMLQVAGGEDTLFYADNAEALYVNENGAVGAFYAPTGLAVVGLDWLGSWTWTRDIPLPTNRVRSLVGLDDGSVVVTPVVETGQVIGGIMYSPPITLWYQPGAEVWSIPAEDCAAITGEGWDHWGDGLQRVAAAEIEGEEGLWEIRVVQVSLESEQE